MKKFGLLGSSAICSAAFMGLVGFAAPAHAQDDTVTTQETETTETGVAVDEDNPDAIVVTGSRLNRPNLNSPVPVTSISGEEFFQQGQLSIGDTLNELPALRSTFGQANAGRFLGTVGLNLLDLRGLGTQRTLVLVNGRRHVASDILANAVSPDVNTIPTDLIERVDVVTGGNSAIYGSDAIAGVVNFILRRDYEGLQVRGQGGISTYGDAGNYYISAMYGRNFADGRANVTIHGEYAHQDLVRGRDRPYILRNDAFVQVDSDTAAQGGFDGNPDRVFFRDIRGSTISSEGLISIPQRTANAVCGTGPNGTPYNCNFLFSPDGQSLIAQTGARVGFGPNGSFIGGNGPSNRDENLITLYPSQDRYNVNLLAHFTISEAFEPFIEAKYVRVETGGRSSGPAFVQGSSIDGNRERIRLDNPFLTPAERTFIANQIIASGINPNFTDQRALTAANLTAIANGSFRFSIRKNFTDLGVRDEESIRETYRAVVGLRGTFNDDWNYEISANYGRFDEETTVLGNIDLQRFLLAIDAGIDPANPGAGIQCRSRFDPTAAFDVVGRSPAELAADIAACVPLNPFGRTDVTAARAYIVQDTISRARLEQLVFSGFVSGDSSQWFELPGGPVRFALGAEYRSEDAFYQADPLVEGGFTFYNALPTFDPDRFNVKEAYAEIEFPILRDTPFFEELVVRGAARVADYNSGAGTVFAYNAGVEWAPIRDIRFRGNYSRAVRAPNVSETAFPLSQNFAPGFQDPCRAANIGAGSQFRAANCLADIGAANLNNPAFANLPAYSLELVSGSNPDLNEETSDSWTIGAVIQPRFIPGLSLTVDYYDITVDDVIQSPTAQTIVNTCYDLPDLNNQFCALFDRFDGPGDGPNQEVPGQILDTSLVVIPLNYAALKVRGLDFELNYRRNIEGWGNLSTRFIYTHVLQNSAFTNPAIPDFENRILSELGDPQDEFLWSIDLQSGPITVGYQMRYIGKQVLNLYEDYFSVQGRAPQDADYADRIYYPSVFYHDIRAAIQATDDFNFYIGVDNLLNRAPPLGVTGTGAGSGIYSVRGRNFYAGFRARF